jgi:hypothetical protein
MIQHLGSGIHRKDEQSPSRFFEIAIVLVRLDHCVSFVENPNHSSM